LTTVNPLDVTQTSKTDKQQTNGSKTDEKEASNRKIMIEIKGNTVVFIICKLY